MSDPVEIRRSNRDRWGRSAGGWRRRADLNRANTMPVTAWMIEAVDPQPGDTLLELAAGVGDVGFMAAELIAPGGTLICSDFIPEMLTAAQERARELGIDNVRFRQLDAESIDQPTASLDGVLCRWGYMLLADGDAALRETRRVLKPGARVALAAWRAAPENPWASVPGRELVRQGLVEPPDPDAPGQFGWAREGRIAAALDSAGFVEYEVDTVAFEITYASFEEWWDVTRDMSRPFDDALLRADPATVEEVREALRAAAADFAAPDGSLVFAAASWVAVAVG